MENKTFGQLILLLFLVANPIAVSPALAMLTKDFEPPVQRRILLQEALIAFLVTLLFLFFGNYFLLALRINDSALKICGGIVLFTIGIQMVFPPKPSKVKTLHSQPFIVPIAVPLIAGGALLSTVMIASTLYPLSTLLIALLITWVPVTLIMVSATLLQKMLGKRGIVALEQLMGMLLLLLSTEILVQGARFFLKSL